MTRLGFLIARTLRQDAPLASLSAGRQSLLADVEGRSVALVGNARSLSEKKLGADIDAADVVVRINRAPMPSAASHGTRTDWLALATSISSSDLDRLNPGRILWMSHKRKRLSWTVAQSTGFYLHPMADYERLNRKLGSQPTTGAMMIDLLSQSGLARLTLYGFDFFASLSLTGSRTAEQVPHDFASERRFVEELVSLDPRITLI